MAGLKFKIMSRVILCLLYVSCHGNEPMCSKFPYEEALLEKMIRMEIKVEQMQSGIGDIKKQVQKEITRLHEKEKEYELAMNNILETSNNSLSDLELSYKRKSKNIKDMFSRELEDMKEMANQNEARFERMSEELRELKNRTTQTILGKTFQCLDGWVFFDESCYLFSHEKKTFTEAEHFCLQNHAHLVRVDNANEDRFLKSFVSRLKDASHWIGLTDVDIEGIWKWSDGTKPGYINWRPTEPNGNKGENCACLYHPLQFTWCDINCATLLMPICELKRT